MFDAADRQRGALETLRLVVSDLPPGSVVALRRADKDPWDPLGYGTHFYIADVHEIIETEPGGGSDAAVRRLACVYRLPIARQQASNDMKKPWHRACCAMHPYDRNCETRRMCVGRRPHGSSTSLMKVEIEADTIFETGITLTSSGLLTMESKRRLAKSAPSAGRAEWLAALGLMDPTNAPERKQRAKKR